MLLSGESRYMTCSTGASKPVRSMSQTTRIEAGRPSSEALDDRSFALGPRDGGGELASSSLFGPR